MKILTSLFLLMINVMAFAQTLTVLPTITPESGTYNDSLKVECTFPEGCAEGIYWVNGGEIKAQTYKEPFVVDYSCSISVAGVNAQGRIITDVVSRDFNIVRTSPPHVTCSPAEGIRKTSFYVTRIKWNNVTTAQLDLSAFKEGQPRRGENVVWVTDESGKTIVASDYNGLWEGGLNQFKAYIYKDYDIKTPGHYVLHIASGVFILDGVRYMKEVTLNYEVADVRRIPAFSVPDGTYEAPLTVSIKYPNDGCAFFMFYKINDEKAKPYTAPLVLTSSCKIEAYGKDEELETATPSAFAYYTINAPAPKPEKLEAPKLSMDGNMVSISGPEGATLKYWFDDRMATASLYSAPFTVNDNCKVACVAYKEGSVSETTELFVTSFPVDRGDMGDQFMKSPDIAETIHVRGLSANGRFAAGFTGEGSSAKGFVWDLDADKFMFQSTVFVNQIYGVADDGTAYGWRLKTTETEGQLEPDDMLWGICKNGIWSEQPKGFTANGISSDGRLIGVYDNRPCIYDFETQEFTYYNGVGALTAINGDGSVAGGFVVEDGVRKAAIWHGTGNPATYYDTAMGSDVSVISLSDNGEWAVTTHNFRINTASSELQNLESMSARSAGTMMPEVLSSVANDGTIFGTYDSSYMNPEMGEALVRTNDGRWRRFTDWLVETEGIEADAAVKFTSVRAVDAEHHVILLHTVPANESSDDAFTGAMALRINVPVKHLAPGGVEAKQINGGKVIKVAWDAPRTNAEDVREYVVRRYDGAFKVITEGMTAALETTVEPAELAYYDKEVNNGETYTYTVSAIYNDEATSKESYPSTATCELMQYRPVRNLSLRCSGLDDVCLTWDAPVTSIPKLQYFNEESEWLAFGTGKYSSEWGIRIPQGDMKVFAGQQIRTFHFLPTGPQGAYTLNLYRGKGNDDYEKTPFYTQEIDPSTLNYGTMNTIEIATPQELPTDCDLYIGLYIQSVGNDNMLGVSYEGFRSGYTDLCRVAGEFDKMLPISKQSSSIMEIVLPLGIGVCDEDSYNGNIISNYEIADNDNKIAATESTKLQVNDVTMGPHDFSVKAIYRDGKASEARKVSIDMKLNEAAFVPAGNFNVMVKADNSAYMSWEQPLDEDLTDIHYGNNIPAEGWVLPAGFDGFMAGSIYPVTMTSTYANDYEICGLYFYPTAEATFTLILSDGGDEVFVVDDITDATPDKLYYYELEDPVTVDPSVNYNFNIAISACDEGKAPLAYDTSGSWKNYYSNIIDYGLGPETLAEIVQIDEHPNWLMGMKIRQIEAEPMAIEGYNVNINGQKVNKELINGNTFTTEPLDKGDYEATVSVVYSPERIVESEAKTFTVENVKDAVSDVTITTSDDKAYDLTGRRVINDKAGRGIFIISGRKIAQ